MKLLRLPVRVALVMTFMLGTIGRGMAQQRSAQRPKRPSNPVYAPIEDDPALPRVLLIGDSISIGYTPHVRELLRGKVDVQRPAENCGPTTRGLQRLDAWLGGGSWDVIHFNFGLHDLKYVNQQAQLVSPDQGAIQVPLADYEANLERIV